MDDLISKLAEPGAFEDACLAYAINILRTLAAAEDDGAYLMRAARRLDRVREEGK